MFPRAFDYAAPATLDETLDCLARHGDDVRLMAGGQSLIPLMKLRFMAPACVIDLARLAELRGIDDKGAEIRCGAMTRHAEIERSALIARRIPMLAQAGGEIADVQVRNRGTLGGALCQADPAGDWAVAALALGARMRCVSRRGEREIDAKAFFADTYTPALEPDEILTDVIFPVPDADSTGVYIKIVRRTGDFAIASVALQMSTDASGRCTHVGLGIGGAGPTPLSPPDIADFLHGRALSDAAIEEACALLVGHLEPIEDLRGSADYKRRVAGVALKRALRRAAEPSHNAPSR